MNPIKALLDSFDRLINERGSAAILRERLALAADQYAMLEKENTSLKTKIQILETENQSLKSEKIELEKKIEDLLRQIKTIKESDKPDDFVKIHPGLL